MADVILYYRDAFYLQFLRLPLLGAFFISSQHYYPGVTLWARISRYVLGTNVSAGIINTYNVRRGANLLIREWYVVVQRAPPYVL